MIDKDNLESKLRVIKSVKVEDKGRLMNLWMKTKGYINN